MICSIAAWVCLKKNARSSPPIRNSPARLLFGSMNTYGFPLDLTQDALRRLDKEVDVEGFDKALAAQRAQGREGWKGSGDETQNDVWLALADRHGATAFLGYEQKKNDQIKSEARIIAIIKDGMPVDEIKAGDQAMLLLDQTPFYAESGGQVGDVGTISAGDNLFDVRDTQKQAGTLHVHIGNIKQGRLTKGEAVRVKIDSIRRDQIRANHSATHLLNEALRRVLGPHVAQKGSLVNENYLRFDFSHPKPLAAEEVAQIEEIVNAQIRKNNLVTTRRDEARSGRRGRRHRHVWRKNMATKSAFCSWAMTRTKSPAAMAARPIRLSFAAALMCIAEGILPCSSSPLSTPSALGRAPRDRSDRCRRAAPYR